MSTISERVPRQRLVAALLPTLLLLGLVVSVPLGAAPASAASYSGTKAAWLYPGRGVGEAGPRVRLGYVKVPYSGTYHATLTVPITDNSADAVQLASISLVCAEGNSTKDKIGTSTNVMRGETFTLSARVFFTVKEKGACFAYGTTMGVKASSASTTSRRVRAKATLTITGPVSDDTRETKRFVYDDANRGFAGKSFLAKPRQQAHAGELKTSARPGTAAKVTGNAYLTTCTSDGGSRDATTNGKYLCTPGVIKHGEAGSLVRLRLVTRQYTAGGSVCATTIVPGSTKQFRISSRRHHLPVAVQGDVTLPDTNTRCGSQVRVWTEVQVLTGPAVVVHFPNTVTAFRPV